jgi:hypothetical protein
VADERFLVGRGTSSRWLGMRLTLIAFCRILCGAVRLGRQNIVKCHRSGEDITLKGRG